MEDESAIAQSITFAFGHIVGTGIQNILAGKSEEQTIWEAFLEWKPDLLARDDKRSKNFFYGIAAIQRFVAMKKSGLLKGYKLIWWRGRPATELGFLITMPDGFRYRGMVDAVLQHEETGEVLVLECKTTGFTYVNAATYKNSSQAIGYSIVLDVLFPKLSSYKVLYLVYKTKSYEYETFQFTKTYLQRAQWIQELIFDVESIQRYESAGVYPMRGESCVRFNRECEFLNVCGLNTKYLVKPITAEQEQEIAGEFEKYKNIISLEQLIHAQLEKSKDEPSRPANATAADEIL